MCGEFGAHMYGCIPAFHDVMEYFVQRYAQACHDQNVSQEDDRMMQRIFQASLTVVQDFRHLVGIAKRQSEAVQCSMLYIMMQAGYSDEEMAATLVNVMIAAGEAPASSLAQTLEEVARNPTIQHGLLEEARATVGKGSFAENVGELSFSDRCIQEGLRLYAPATLVQRSAQQDCELQGVFLPKGTVVGVCVHSVHNNPATWENPTQFNPLRDGLDYEMADGYATFSKGPRGCPGKHVAICICKMALAMIVEQYELSVAQLHSARSGWPKSLNGMVSLVVLPRGYTHVMTWDSDLVAGPGSEH